MLTHNKMIKSIYGGILSFLIALGLGCQQSNDANKHTEAIAQQNLTPVQTERQDGLEEAYFASGCFWCVEGIYEEIIGVTEAVSGYSGGTTPNPTYYDHGDHAETIKVIYNPLLVDFKTLLDVYFGSQNITQVNGQGPDRGTSYRSIVFYQNETEKKLIEDKISTLNLRLDGEKVAAQVLPFQKFYVAEAYHQDFKKKNPDHPYIQNISEPRKKKFEKKFPELLKENQNKTE